MTINERIYQHHEFVKDQPELKNADNFVLVTALCGSQNYQMADEDSDIDTKSIIIPGMDDLLAFNGISLEYRLPNDEHADAKDIRLMFNSFLKGNPNFLELLYTDYYAIDSRGLAVCTWNDLRSMREEISNCNRANTFGACYGAIQRYHKLIINYPTEYKKQCKWLSHMMRYSEFMTKLERDMPFKDCLIPYDPEWLLIVKRGQDPAFAKSDDTIYEANGIMDYAEERMNAHLIPRDEDAIKRMKIKLDDLAKIVIKEYLEECRFDF